MQEVAKRSIDGIRRLVLIVDDEQVNRRMLGRIIEKDYDVIYAENGREAVELIKNRHKTLSIILLDIIMPEMNGYEVIGFLRDDPELSRIPVIVLTSERLAEVKSLQLGAVDFIPKPYDMPEVILARVRRSIELAEDSSIIRSVITQTARKRLFLNLTISTLIRAAIAPHSSSTLKHPPSNSSMAII